MKNFSVTISGLVAVILGLIIEDQTVVNALVPDLLTIGGILIAWYGRWRHGDISLVGLK